MEPSSSRRRAATAWAANHGSAGGSAGGSAAPSTHARAALQFAEQREYCELLHAVQLRPEVAAASDAFGMTPLHWLCSDRDVPLRALQQLVLADPTATTKRNLAGLLPLHLAVRKDLALDALKTVLKFHPKAIVAETPDGQTPVQLAQEHVTSRSTRHFLRKLEHEVRSLARGPSTASTDTAASADKTAWEDGYPVAIIDASMSSQPSASQRSLDDRALDGVGTRPLPPVWKLNTCCYVCETKFGYFKKRHHCRNCGESVCGRHSKHSVPLKHLGLFHAQRVCSGCYARLQSHYTSQAVARLSPHSAAATKSHPGEDVTHESLLPHTHPYHAPSPLLHGRHVRSRSAHSMTFAHQAQQHPLLSPRAHHMQTPSPLTISPPPSTRVTRSATMSPRTTRSASTNTMLSGVSSATSTMTTASNAYQPNFIKMPSGMSMHITHLQRTDDHGTVLDRQREMQRRRDRLANTDLETYAWQGRDSETSSPRDNQEREEDKELLMEMQMEKLLLAKKQIRDALQRSKRDADDAQAEKDKYDGLAKEYEQRGYSCSSDGLDKDDANDNGTYLDSDGGADDVRSYSSSCAAAKYGYTPCEDNQQEHDGDNDSIIVHGAAFNDNNNNHDDDDDDSAVYGLVPETTPGDPVHKDPSPLFDKDSLDMPLDIAATYLDLGIVLLAKGDFIGAAIELQKSLDHDQQNAQAWYHFAKALDGKGESEEAENAIQKSLAIEPNSLPSLSLLGKLLNARGEHDEAILVFRQALNLQCPSDNPPPVRAH